VKPNHRRKDVAKDTYSGSFYCVKCKDHRDATGDVVVNEKGTRIAKAKCPVCGTNLTRFLPKA
jgi:ribosomal protein S27E